MATILRIAAFLIAMSAPILAEAAGIDVTLHVPGIQRQRGEIFAGLYDAAGWSGNHWLSAAHVTVTGQCAVRPPIMVLAAKSVTEVARFVGDMLFLQPIPLQVNVEGRSPRRCRLREEPWQIRYGSSTPQRPVVKFFLLDLEFVQEEL